MSNQVRLLSLLPEFSPRVQNVIVCNLLDVLSCYGTQKKSIFKSFKLNWNKRASYWLQWLFFCSSLHYIFLFLTFCAAPEPLEMGDLYDIKDGVFTVRLSLSEWQYLRCPLQHDSGVGGDSFRHHRACCDITNVMTGEGAHHTMHFRWSAAVMWAELIWITCQLTSTVLLSELILSCKKLTDALICLFCPDDEDKDGQAVRPSRHCSTEAKILHRLFQFMSFL